MERIYNFILDNVYVFCVIMAAFFVIMVMIFYYIQDRRYNKNNNDIDYIPDDPIDKEKLESITDEEIEKRILEEYKKEKEETINELKEQQEESKPEVETKKDTGTNIEEILSALENAKRAEPKEVVKTFEDEQEEQAIISYSQLVDSVKNNKIKITDDEDLYKEQEKEIEDEKYKLLVNELENEPVMESKTGYTGSSTGFKANEFISPVFGRMDSSNVKYRQGLEYTDKKPKASRSEEYIKDKPSANEFINNYSEKPEIETSRVSRANYELLDEIIADKEIEEKKEVMPERTTMYRYKTPIDEDTEILADDVGHNFMKHAEMMDSEEFLNKLKEFRNNL